MSSVEERYGPVIEVYEVEGSRERRIVIGYKMGGTSRFFSALSNLYHFYSLYSARKYVGASLSSLLFLFWWMLKCGQNNSLTALPSFRSTSTPSPMATRHPSSILSSKS